MSATLEAHPAALFFPMLSGKQFDELKADIALNGLLQPIWLYEGKILDGRNRYRACVELDIQPKIQIYSGSSPVAGAWALNGQRRHLTPSQRAAIGVEMLPALEEEARKRQEASRAIEGEKIGQHKASVQILSPKKGKAVQEAAHIVGVGETNVQLAKRIKLTDPVAFEQIKAGTLTIGAVRAKHGASPAPEAAKQPRAVRLQQIRDLAKEGHRASQIATEMNVHEKTVRKLAQEEGISLPDAQINKSHRITAFRVLEQTAIALEGLAMGVKTADASGLSSEQAREWSQSLSTSIRILSQFKNKVMEIAREQQQAQA